jgi:RNA polymerase sigma-70 factor (ECF subfamily)
MKVLSQLTDAELIHLFANGNDAAFKELLHRYKRKVFSSILFIIKDRETAEDIFQDVFLKVITKLREGRYEENGRFSFWLFRLTHNACIDYLRQKKNRTKALFEDEEHAIRAMDKALMASSETKSPIQNPVVKSAIRKIVSTLPESQREVFILRNLVGYSFKEIAEYQGVSINTAIGRMRYALLTIKKQLYPAQKEHK